MARAAPAHVSQWSQSEMCTDYNMPISCCQAASTSETGCACKLFPHFYRLGGSKPMTSAFAPSPTGTPRKESSASALRRTGFPRALAHSRAARRGSDLASRPHFICCFCATNGSCRPAGRLSERSGLLWASHCGAKLECRTVSPTLMPSRCAVPPFNSSTANSEPGGPMMSRDRGVARAAM